MADYNSELHYSDTNEVRIFCFKRYELSKLLPDIVISINKARCFHTGRGNFFTVRLKDETGQEGEYEIYFNVTKTQNSSKMRLYVESAYIRDGEYGSSQPAKKKINFFVIAHNRQNNRPIRTPK